MAALLHSRRIKPVITGYGIVGPTGHGVPKFWEMVKDGRSAIREISLFDASPYASRIAGEADTCTASDWVERSPIKFQRCARHTQMALVALEEALLEARLPEGRGRFAPVHVVMGGGIGAFDVVHASSVALQRSHRRASPVLVTAAAPQATAAAIAGLLGDAQFVTTVSTACASGLDAIGQAAELIRRGAAELVIAGGADSPLSPVPFANLVAAGMASCRNEEPERASRPFDRDRDSGVISEGACVVVLESLGHALSRGVTPKAELLGYANQIDPPESDPGMGFVHSMRAALRNAGCRPEDVDHVNAWGPGHPVMDRIETEAIKEVFQHHAYSLPICSIKGVVGNPFSAAGPMQVVTSALTLSEGILPPTANHDYPDPDCDLDYIPKACRVQAVSRVLLNAHGVGGGNCSLVMSSFDP